MPSTSLVDVPLDLAKPTASRRQQELAALGVAMLGFFVVALDAQIVNVAVPDIARHLGGGLSGPQWVVTATYTLTFSSLLFGGTVADRVGARRTYGIGMAVFVAASLLCGHAPSLEVLIDVRVSVMICRVALQRWADESSPPPCSRSASVSASIPPLLDRLRQTSGPGQTASQVESTPTSFGGPIWAITDSA